MTSRSEDPRPKRQYTKPGFASSAPFERMALACIGTSVGPRGQQREAPKTRQQCQTPNFS
jgi:hypothetical protein